MTKIMRDSTAFGDLMVEDVRVFNGVMRETNERRLMMERSDGYQER